MTVIGALGLLVASATVGGAKEEEFVAAVPRDFPPYYRVDSQGQPAGHSIEIMGRLAEIAHLRIRYVVKPDWESTMEALRQGEADLIPSLGITPERARDFDFTAPLETLALGLFVRSDDRAIHGIEGLAGKKVAMVKGNAAITWLDNYPMVQGRTFETPEEALFALLAGGVDAFIYPDGVAWKMASAIGVDQRIRQAGMPLVEVKRAVAVRKGHQGLLQRLEGAVREYTHSEQFGEAYARLHAVQRPFWTRERLVQYVVSIAAVILGLLAVALGWWGYRTTTVLKRRLAECSASLECSKAELDALRSGSGESGGSDAKAQT